MSWLSGGLNQFSSITGQISSFTKEVLTETTEEIADPAAELQVLRQKHEDLDKSYRSLQLDLERLRLHSEEQEERAETAEYQISTISQEYRKLVESRDAEIRSLKTENERLREVAKGHTAISDPQSPLKELALLSSDISATPYHEEGFGGEEYQSVDIGGSEEWAGHHDDFGDVISSQTEINRLRLELSTLKTELQHWKNKSTDKDTVDGTSEVVKQKEVQEKEQHQQEITSLQMAHQQRLHFLTQRHQQEIAQLQEKIDSSAMQDARVKEVEELNSNLLEQLKLLKSRYKQEVNDSELLQKLAAEQESRSHLTAQVKHLTDQHHQERLQYEQLLSQEKDKLKQHLSDMQAKIQEHHSSISALQEQHKRAKDESLLLQEQIETLSSQVTKKDKEIGFLKAELDDKVQQDTCGGEEGDDSVIRKARKKVERELAALREELLQSKREEESLKAKYSQMEISFSEERENGAEIEAQLTQVKADLDYYRTAFDGKASELSQAIEARTNLTRLLAAKEEDIRSLKSNLETQQKFDEKDQDMESLRRTVAALKEKESVLEVKLQTVEKERFVQKEENQKLCDNLQEYSKQLSNLKAHLVKVEEQHGQESIRAQQRETYLKQQVAHLQEKLVATSTTGAQISDENQKQLLELEKELQKVREERDDALLRMSNAQEQAELNAESLRNLQAVLEQFQRDNMSELSQALKKSQLELVEVQAECQQLRVEQKSLETQLNDATAAAEAAAVLNQELEEKETKLSRLSQEVSALHLSLEDKLKTIEKLSQEGKSQVDKNLMKNLVVGYVHAPESKKPEILQLIAKILDFTPAELKQMIGNTKGWLGGPRRTTHSSPQSEATNSLSQLFVKFLEQESSPQHSQEARQDHPIPSHSAAVKQPSDT